MKKSNIFSDLPELNILRVVLLIQSMSLMFLDVYTATVIFNWVSIGYVMAVAYPDIKIRSGIRVLAMLPLIATLGLNDFMGDTGYISNVLLMVVYTVFRIVIPTILVLIDRLVSSSKND
ncbi:MAG: hypothetical protein PHI65_07335 [Firmicutes bacterium]|nr:hypothetical protein [Bacillota bacterium]